MSDFIICGFYFLIGLGVAFSQRYSCKDGKEIWFITLWPVFIGIVLGSVGGHFDDLREEKEIRRNEDDARRL